MQAVIESGNKQYIVKEGDEVLVEKLPKKEGDKINLEDVLLIIDGDKIIVGRPHVKGAKVTANLIAQEKGPKRVIFRYRRREQYKRKVGHRQKFTRIKIDKITV